MRYLLLGILICLFQTSLANADLYVLCYHSFLGKPTVPYDFSIEELKNHLEYFKSKGFKFVSYRDFIEGNVIGKKNILVTIDDGNHSVYKAYYEVFKPMGIKPLLSIYPNIIGKKEYAMNWEQLKELVAEGCEIAAHGFFHLKLNAQLYTERRKEFLQEIRKPQKILEEKLNTRVTSFVYPFGLVSDDAEKELREAGYKTAFTILSKPVKIPLEQNQNPYRLGRFMFTRPLAKSHMAHITRLANGSDTKHIAKGNRYTDIGAAKNIAFLQNKNQEPSTKIPSLQKKEIQKSEKQKSDISSKQKKQKKAVGEDVFNEKNFPEIGVFDPSHFIMQNIDVIYRMNWRIPTNVSEKFHEKKINKKDIIDSPKKTGRAATILSTVHDCWQKIFQGKATFYGQFIDFFIVKINLTISKIASCAKSLSEQKKQTK